MDFRYFTCFTPIIVESNLNITNLHAFHLHGYVVFSVLEQVNDGHGHELLYLRIPDSRSASHPKIEKLRIFVIFAS